MTAPRIKSLSIKGFRAYGAAEQTLNLTTDLAVVWAPNSKGKTSLAEAFEFLLTGRITRRELMASTQDEFADALRNAHLQLGEDVYVAARITAKDGSEHEIKRVLTSDYAKRRDCTTILLIDGSKAAEEDLTALGIILSQPPLRAPVLAQHTLSYIFSVRPQDRATYFKTLLEVTDLDIVRNDIAALADGLKVPENPLLTKLDLCINNPILKPVFSGYLFNIPGVTEFSDIVQDAARTLIDAAGEEVPEGLTERLTVIESVLVERRSKTFPIREFGRKEFSGWNPPSQDIWLNLETYIIERKKVDEETRRLVSLFNEALKVPVIAGMSEPVDCPLCGTAHALTIERMQMIRQYVEDTKDFNNAEEAAKKALSQISAIAQSLSTSVEAALPRYLKMTATERRQKGFIIARIRDLLSEKADDVVSPWLVKVRPLVRVGFSLRRSVLNALSVINKVIDDIGKLDTQELKAIFSALGRQATTFVSVLNDYKEPVETLSVSLNEVLDTESDTSGWQEFLDIARQYTALREALVERAARVAVETELDLAVKQIDRGKEQVLDDKFAEYSGLIQTWWERLRPDETTFFSAVKPRRGARRTIDLKAGLSAHTDRSSPKMRDVIAVFSQSQLHCLGLAMFLARAQHEGLGFIVLDDPVLSSDEDYRVHFNSTVLTELLKLPMQVIVLTQDHATWEELEIRYRHQGVSNAQLYVETPAEGSIIENTSDALLAKISRAKSLARGGHPDSRKECGIQLRDAGERFCKEMLVNNRSINGDAQESLSDYDGKTLEWLSPHVDPLLIHDASHPGKFAVFKKAVNTACHDNAPPSNAEMIQACGEIRYLVKTYLDR